MLILKPVLFLLGVAFVSFGYFIYFKKRYFLINGFEEAFKSGERDESYAKRVGLTELIIGIIMIISSVVLFIFA